MLHSRFTIKTPSFKDGKIVIFNDLHIFYKVSLLDIEDCELNRMIYNFKNYYRSKTVSNTSCSVELDILLYLKHFKM